MSLWVTVVVTLGVVLLTAVAAFYLFIYSGIYNAAASRRESSRRVDAEYNDEELGKASCRRRGLSRSPPFTLKSHDKVPR